MKINAEDYYISREKNGYHKIAEKHGFKNGIIDKDLNIIIAPIYEICSDASDTAFWLYDYPSSNHKDLSGVVDFELVFLSTLENFNQIRHEIFDTYTAHPSQFLYYAKVIRKLILPNFDEMRNLLPGNCWYIENEKYGLIQKDGKVIIEPSFDEVKLNYNGNATVRKEKKFAVFDNFGKIIIPFTSDMIVYWGENKYTQEIAKKEQTKHVIETKETGETEMEYCAYCGAEMALDASFCSKCGKKRGEKHGTGTNQSLSLPNTILFSYQIRERNIKMVKYKTEEKYLKKINEILINKMRQVWKEEYVSKIVRDFKFHHVGNQMEFTFYDFSFFYSGKGKLVYDTFMEFLTENNYKIRMIGNNTDYTHTTTNDCVAGKI